MIHIDRSPAPPVFRSKAVEGERARAARFFAVRANKREQRRYDYRPLASFEKIRTALTAQFRQKCAYCESALPGTDSVAPDHFRPKAGAVGRDGSMSPDHYYWLMYEWENLYLSCVVCSRRKGPRFPIRGKRVRVGVRGEALQSERPLILDPCADEPEKHLVFTEDGRVASSTEEGVATIDVFDLNRDPLVLERGACAKALLARLHNVHLAEAAQTDVAQRLRDELLDRSEPFLAMKRQLIARFFQKQLSHTAAATIFSAGGQDEGRTADDVESVVKSFAVEQRAIEAFHVSDRSLKATEHYFAKSRLISRIELENVKAIRSLSLVFPEPGEETAPRVIIADGASFKGSIDMSGTPQAPWLMLLGENGTGKSTVLQAVALALMGKSHRDSLESVRPAHYVRMGTNEGQVRVHLTGRREPIQLVFRPKGDWISNEEEPKVLLLGYGATRLLPRGGAKPDKADSFVRTRNLFDPFTPLGDAEQFISKLQHRDFQLVARALRDLLLLDDDQELVRSGRGPAVRKADGTIPVSQLSDGEQSVLALAIDMIATLRNRWQRMDAAEGIVVVDELGPHLHPRWKMRIVQTLRRAFPRVQFLTTTHDPLCLRGLKEQEVVKMTRASDNRIVALTGLPSPAGLRVDQLLTSEHFGLSSTVEPELEKMFAEYYQLLTREDPTAGEAARLEDLKTSLRTRGAMGQDAREQLMLQAADAFLARRRQETDQGRREKLRQDTIDEIAALWSSMRPDGEPASPAELGDET